MRQAVRTYRETWNHYDKLREQALMLAYEQLPSVLRNKYGETHLKSSISLNGLDFQTFQRLKNWKYMAERVADWDWDEVRKKYKTHPKRFELSIWHKELFLTGASIGAPTWGGNKLRVDFIEAYPKKSPLDGLITDIVITAGQAYAKLIGAAQLRIMHPVNDKVKSYYLSKGGFSYNKTGNYCYLDL